MDPTHEPVGHARSLGAHVGRSSNEAKGARGARVGGGVSVRSLRHLEISSRFGCDQANRRRDRPPTGHTALVPLFACRNSRGILVSTACMMPLPALLGLISLGFLASSSSALLLPLTRSQVAFRPACGAHRAPAAFAMSAETVEAAEDALAKATATEAKAVSELAAAIAADDDTVGCIVDAENADVRRRATQQSPVRVRLRLG